MRRFRPRLSRIIRSGMSALLVALAACQTDRASAPNPPPNPAPPSPRAVAFLDTVSERTFRFFWDTQNPTTHLIPDRWPTPSFSSIAAVGFGLNAYAIGAERGWVSRAQARDRTLETLQSLYMLPQGPAATGVAGYKGFYYHFLDMETGMRYKDVELSSVDTSLLLAGVLFGQSYFDGADPAEVSIRAYADSIYRRVDWAWFRNQSPLLSMSWSPEKGFNSYQWRGLNEAMIVYLLALGSPTHPIDSTAWPAWTSTYKWGSYYGQQHVGFAPLFGHQYSQVWVDFRGIQDEYMRGHGIDYFENSRRATVAQRAYAADNPNGWTGYAADMWGITASDGPFDGTLTIAGKSRHFYSYAARGTDFTETRDDGTIAPTAAGGSVAFAPAIAIEALVAMRDRYGDNVFSRYGFVDAFNPTLVGSAPITSGRIVPGLGWFDGDYLGIDQGPILAMLENYHSELIWKRMRTNPYLIRGLQRAGFTGGWLAGGAQVSGQASVPAGDRITLRFWALGAEGEHVQQLVRDFEQLHPNIDVRVQQIPWTAAHEKLLTAFVGNVTPDLAQLGNTWVPELQAVDAIVPLEPYIAGSTVVKASRVFPGIWATNVIDNTVYAIPWYVDTRVLFYRTDILAAAGYDSMPQSWAEWRKAMEAIQKRAGKRQWAIFLPTNEWMQPVVFGLQNGSPLLKDGGRYGAFDAPAFRGAYDFYLGLFRDGLAPVAGNNDIANAYQEFARGTFAMWITGPWNIGEFQRRLPPEMQHSWATAPLPGPTGALSGVSNAGGSSLVVFRRSKHPEAAWQLIEFLSQPEIQRRFYRLTGDLPAQIAAWQDSSLAGNKYARAFYTQLQRVRPTPKVPEWEFLTSKIIDVSESSIRGGVSTDRALAQLDTQANRILEKRRWILARSGRAPGSPAAAVTVP